MREAARAVRPSFGNVARTGHTTKDKGLDFGIQADLEAEQILLAAIRRSGLRASVITEESAEVAEDGADMIIFVDPIDGTVNFAHGTPCYCHTLAIFSATQPQQPIFAATYDPNLDEMFTVISGEGVFVNETPVTRAEHELKPSIHLDWIGAPQLEATLHALVASGFRPRIGGSGALAAMYGAIGRGSGAVLVHNHAWDVAAGIAAAVELGLQATQLNGEPYDLLQKGKMDTVIAPNTLHARLLAALHGVPSSA